MVSPQPLIDTHASHPQSFISNSSSSSKVNSLSSPLLLQRNHSFRNNHNTLAQPHASTHTFPSSYPSKYPVGVLDHEMHGVESGPYLWELYDLPASDSSLLSFHSLDQPPMHKQTTHDFISDMVMPPQCFNYHEDAFGGLNEMNSHFPSSNSPSNAQLSSHKHQQSWSDVEESKMDESDHNHAINGKSYDSSSSTHVPSMPSLLHLTPSVEESKFDDEECEEKESAGSSLADLPPLSPHHHVDAHHRVQGKLTRFLPGSSLVNSDNGNGNGMVDSEADATNIRSMRPRRISVEAALAGSHSRSSSPSLESHVSDSDAESDYTDHYEQEEEVEGEEEQMMESASSASMDDSMELDDSLSPPAVRYEDLSSSSGQSSAEPPQPTQLLPVSAKDLLPSRPSTGVVPAPHIKDRLVRSAKKLLTAADGVNDSVQVLVIPLWFPSKQAPNAHKIRLIRVENTEADGAAVSVYAHAADVGGVVERKSNISRLFGKFESPSEKLLCNVPGTHNHKIGQESNILTFRGVKKFLHTNKMKEEPAYFQWIQTVLLPCLLHDPLEVATEMLEIEASTDPNAPHSIKPKKMKRMEKKLEKKEAEKKMQMALQQQQQQSSSSSHPVDTTSSDKKSKHEKVRKHSSSSHSIEESHDDGHQESKLSVHSPPSLPSTKRQKYYHHTPAHAASQVDQMKLQFANSRMSNYAA